MRISLLAPLLLSIFSTAAIATTATPVSPATPAARLERLMELKDVLSGPNCWNAATYVAGINPYILLTTELQASLLFRGSCRPLPGNPDDAPAGSVVRISADGEEVHAFFALGNRQFFQKRDNSSDGRYEIVAFADIEKHYGKDRYCQGSGPCGWATQNLHCTPGKAFPGLKSMPNAFGQLLARASAMTIDSREFRAHSEAFGKALAAIEKELPATAAFLRNTDVNTAALLFDLTQTIRLLGADLPAKLGKAEAENFKKSFDARIWPLVEAYAERKNLGKAELSVLYDFVYGASGSGTRPDRLREKVTRLIGPLLNDKKKFAATRIRLLGNPNFAYADAAPYVAESLRATEHGDGEAAGAIAFFLRFSASPVTDRLGTLRRLACSERLPADERTASDLAHSIFAGDFSAAEKRSLFRCVEAKQTEATREDLRKQYAAELAVR